MYTVTWELKKQSKGSHPAASWPQDHGQANLTFLSLSLLTWAHSQ